MLVSYSAAPQHSAAWGQRDVSALLQLAGRETREHSRVLTFEPCSSHSSHDHCVSLLHHLATPFIGPPNAEPGCNSAAIPHSMRSHKFLLPHTACAATLLTGICAWWKHAHRCAKAHLCLGGSRLRCVRSDGGASPTYPSSDGTPCSGIPRARPSPLAWQSRAPAWTAGEYCVRGSLREGAGSGTPQRHRSSLCDPRSKVWPRGTLTFKEWPSFKKWPMGTPNQQGRSSSHACICPACSCYACTSHTCTFHACTCHACICDGCTCYACAHGKRGALPPVPASAMHAPAMPAPLMPAHAMPAPALPALLARGAPHSLTCHSRACTCHACTHGKRCLRFIPELPFTP
eukprot:1158697-Pelagomonas_calceolata.AAC.12